MSDRGYIHGYTDAEQQRLLAQADFLASWVFDGVVLPARGRLLELGAGVGAQTRHLLEKSGAQVLAAELDARQVATLRRTLAEPIAGGRVLPLRADIRALPLAGASVDGAFCCWVLEHVPRPGEVLRELVRVLRPGATASFVEVHNQSFTLLPRDPPLYAFWDRVNAIQAELGGDPWVGPRLPALLAASGYTDITIRFKPVHGDARDPSRRTALMTYYRALSLSAVPQVVARDGVDAAALTRTVDAAFDRAIAEPDSIFLYTFAQVTARKPE